MEECSAADSRLGACVSSTPVKYGGYFPEFFPSSIDQPSPILPSTSRQSPPNSTQATPHQLPNLKVKTAFNLRQEKVQQLRVTTG